jgi:hypothetical protein
MTAIFEFLQTLGMVFVALMARFAVLLVAFGALAVAVLLVAGATKWFKVHREPRQVH